MVEAAQILNIEAPDLYAVLARELGHLKCDHGVWLTFANTLILGAYSVPGLGGLIAQNLEEQLLHWLCVAELTCDRAALLVALDPKVVGSVLMKLAGGCPSLADQQSVTVGNHVAVPDRNTGMLKPDSFHTLYPFCVPARWTSRQEVRVQGTRDCCNVQLRQILCSQSRNGDPTNRVAEVGVLQQLTVETKELM
ncbi:hypothetical protein MLD38_013098 [Melastoma candidum]|uniref:Uncharacterized protein n=1 Tax=Melastoma candidum TaxID=119954 RepID=A0ACB9RCN8_9MYRT|nr:hypothetical protein MLD38_013098 [Melastoma candidum]